MTYYLKYRPQKLEELDSENVRESLKKIVSSGKIPQAFLFAGPKGTGKTSAARIIAKIVNCENNQKELKEPCDQCEQCKSIAKGSNLDVIELDAASHRGIEDIRALREAVKLAPAKARKKIYIIDEAHMLTTEASNALLKTLEEPPNHVVFILATTNPEKLIETIRSRTTQVLFKKASVGEIKRSLTRVVKGEKIKVDDESLEIIAEKSEGSFRDAVKILEQLIVEKRSLKSEDIKEYLLQHAVFNIDDLIAALLAKDTKKCLSLIEGAALKGVSMQELTENVLANLRVSLLAKMGIGEETLPELGKDEIVFMINLFSRAGVELKGALIEQLPLELAVVEWCTSGVTSPEKSIRSTSSANTSVPKSEPEKEKRPIKDLKELSEEVWRELLATIKPINTSIEALLRAAKPISFDGKDLTLGVYYRFHKEKLEEGMHRKILEEVAAHVLGHPSIRVICTLTEPPSKKIPKAEKQETILTEEEDKDIIKVAEEIFGN